MTRKKRVFADAVAFLAAAAVAALALTVSVHYLSAPHTALEWAVQLCTALTVGIIIFFLVWGHFQELPVPREREAP